MSEKHRKLYKCTWICLWASLWVGWTENVTGVILPRIMKTSINDVDFTGLNISRSDMMALKSQLQFEWSPSLVRDPIEMAGLLEGDILPHPRAQGIKQGGAQDKNAVSDYFRLWPGGVVPYQFSAEFKEEEEEENLEEKENEEEEEEKGKKRRREEEKPEEEENEEGEEEKPEEQENEEEEEDEEKQEEEKN
ncbi:chromo domain-containing protein cec-1-like [Palaemon carinicauda]|uniref:chromo domain-containing protein cec-1-like n=1 Tax=Palaemon carinicauda TaxID=392227 RepID=UPI0035B61DD7